MNRTVTVKHIFSTLMDLSLLIQNRQKSLQEDLDTARLLMQRVVEFELLTIFQYDVLEKKLLPVCQYGTPFNLVDSVNFKLGKGATARCFNSLQTVHIGHLHRESDRKLKFVNSFMAIPLLFNGEGVGVMVAGHTKGHFFEKSDRFFFELIAPTICMLMIKGQKDYAKKQNHLAEEISYD